MIKIDRKTWRHSGDASVGKGPTKLLNKEGYMCCLGFISQYPKLMGLGEPYELDIDIPFLTEDGKNTQVTTRAMRINDDEYSSMAHKEEKLIELFEGIIDIEFIN
jgi:hypothetical protein